MESDWIRIDEAMLLTGRGFDTLENWVLGKVRDGVRQEPIVPFKVIDGLPHWHRPTLVEVSERFPYTSSARCQLLRKMAESESAQDLDAIADKLFSTPEGRAAIIRRIQGVA